MEFRNLTVRSSTYNREGSDDIAYVGVHMRTFLMRGASNISYIRSNVGPNSNADEMNWISAPYQSSTPSRNILFDGTLIHDFVKHNDGAHIDCIGIDDVDGLTIRNSVFRNCEHFALLFGTDASTNRGARNVLLENNFLDCCVSGYYSIGFGQVDGPMMVRHNSTNKPFGWLGGPVHGVTIDSNVLANNSESNCDKAKWSYNVVRDGSPCSGNGKIAEPGFRNSAAADFHLVPGAAAIDAGNPAALPARDIDGQSRTGNRADAGADEANPTSGSAPPAGSGAPSQRFRQRKLAAGRLRATARLQKMSLRRMVKRGLRLEVRCSAFCVVGAKARVAKSAARRLHIRRTLDTAHGRRATSGTVVLHLRPSKRQAKRLRHLKKVRLTVRVGVRSRGGRTDRATFRVALRH
jgi:hypothetical protein